MALEYSVTSGTYSDHPGVESRVPGWGDTNTTEYIDPSYTAWLLDNVGQYAAPLINGKAFIILLPRSVHQLTGT